MMRLPLNYQTTITETATKIFGEKASVWLFGSRLDDNAKGGDVDLLIKLETPTANKAVLGARFNALLQIKLGLQKFDVIVIDPSTVLKQIHQQALSKGVRL
jgi:predicted nucleotidyltransferase